MNGVLITFLVKSSFLHSFWDLGASVVAHNTFELLASQDIQWQIDWAREGLSAVGIRRQEK